MIEQDTIKLLRECDAGAKMGISSLEEVLGDVKSSALRNCLSTCKDEHEKLTREIQSQLERYKDDGKDPNPIAKGMSWIKTNVKMAIMESDHTIADLITDGCNMGVKSLHRYMNQYKSADSTARDVAEKLSGIEEDLAYDVRPFL